MVDPVSSGANSASQHSRTGLADNFEMFLTLLTEQLKNQDPLEPLDSNQFVSQLVEFSSVEQLIDQNESLDTLIGLQVAGIGGAAVGYLGQEIRYAGASNELTPDGARWTYAVDGEPTTVSIAVVDQTGKVVYGTDGEIATGEHAFDWDGLDSAGQPVPPDTYRLEVGAATDQGGQLPVTIHAIGKVTGVDLAGSEPVLLVGGARAPFSAIQSVQAPATPPPDPDE